MACFDHLWEVKLRTGWRCSPVSASLGLDKKHRLVSRNAFISLTKITEVDSYFEMPTLWQRNDPNGCAGRQLFARGPIGRTRGSSLLREAWRDKQVIRPQGTSRSDYWQSLISSGDTALTPSVSTFSEPFPLDYDDSRHTVVQPRNNLSVA